MSKMTRGKTGDSTIRFMRRSWKWFSTIGSTNVGNGHITQLMVNVTDDILFSGSEEVMGVPILPQRRKRYKMSERMKDIEYLRKGMS